MKTRFIRLFLTALSKVTAKVLSAVSAALGASGVTFSWTSPSPGDTIVEYGLTSLYGYTANNPGQSSVTSHSLLLDFTSWLGILAENTIYHYRVRSNALYSDDATFTTGSFVSNVSAAVSGTTLTITWNTLVAGTSGVEYGTDSNYGQAVLNEGEGLVTSHTVVLDASDGIQEGHTYYYRVGSQIDGVWYYGEATSVNSDINL